MVGCVARFIMSGKLPTYLKTYRKKLGLSQGDLALLFGYQTGSTVSRYERSRRPPSRDDVFASVFIFGVPDHELFPSTFRNVAKLVQARAHRLLEQEKGNPRRNVRRTRSLEKIVSQDVDGPCIKPCRNEAEEGCQSL